LQEVGPAERRCGAAWDSAGHQPPKTRRRLPFPHKFL